MALLSFFLSPQILADSHTWIHLCPLLASISHIHHVSFEKGGGSLIIKGGVELRNKGGWLEAMLGHSGVHLLLHPSGFSTKHFSQPIAVHSVPLEDSAPSVLQPRVHRNNGFVPLLQPGRAQCLTVSTQLLSKSVNISESMSSSINCD